MFKRILRELEKEVSGEIAYNYVSEISRHHRIQASPGFRAAVQYAVDQMRERDLKAEVDSYPADGETYSWSSFHFMEWECTGAELKLMEPAEEARAPRTHPRPCPAAS